MCSYENDDKDVKVQDLQYFPSIRKRKKERKKTGRKWEETEAIQKWEETEAIEKWEETEAIAKWEEIRKNKNI